MHSFNHPLKAATSRHEPAARSTKTGACLPRSPRSCECNTTSSKYELSPSIHPVLRNSFHKLHICFVWYQGFAQYDTLVLRASTKSSSAAAPNWIELFNEITYYVSELRNPNQSEPAFKKRKIAEDTLRINSFPNGTNSTNRNGTVVPAINDDQAVLLQVKDISLVIPQRKRYTLEFTASHIRARHPDTNELAQGISYSWEDIS